MDVILHLGAHRTGTTTFQDYLQRYQPQLNARGVAAWGPRRTRRGVFSDVLTQPAASAAIKGGRLQVQLDLAANNGVRSLVISDENMIGSVRANLRNQSLYADIGDRMQRFSNAFGGRISQVVICPRSLEYFWGSSIAFAVARGLPVPDVIGCRKIAQVRRGWRDVVTDLAQALPGVDIRIVPFENVVGQPEALLRMGAGVDAPVDFDRKWLNRSPTLPELRRALAERPDVQQELPFGMGRWNPFLPEDTAALREHYADDMMWLVAGAGGYATLIEDCTGYRAGTTPPPRALTKGHNNERQEGSMA